MLKFPVPLTLRLARNQLFFFGKYVHHRYLLPLFLSMSWNWHWVFGKTKLTDWHTEGSVYYAISGLYANRKYIKVDKLEFADVCIHFVWIFYLNFFVIFFCYDISVKFHVLDFILYLYCKFSLFAKFHHCRSTESTL